MIIDISSTYTGLNIPANTCHVFHHILIFNDVNLTTIIIK